MIPVAVLIAATAALGAGASAKSLFPQVDVIASSETTGDVAWKVWRVSHLDSGLAQRVMLELAPGSLNVAALRSLSQGTAVGTATITQQLDGDSTVTGTEPLQLGSCDEGATGSEATLRFEAVGSTGFSTCVPVAVALASDGTAELTPDLAGVTDPHRLDLRFDNRDTAAGALIPPNPRNPVERDVSVTRTAPTVDRLNTVREISGGDTGVVIRANRDHVVYGRWVRISGRVLRGSRPSAGERVVVRDSRSEESIGVETGVDTIADDEGRFSVEVKPTSVTRWEAWAWKIPDSGFRLNLLAGVLPKPVVVRAPKPTIRKRAAHRLASRLVRAEIVVHNPILNDETLYGRLYVNGKVTVLRRFPFASGDLVFRVRGKPGTRVRVAIGRWQAPLLAAGWSRVVRL